MQKKSENKINAKVNIEAAAADKSQQQHQKE